MPGSKTPEMLIQATHIAYSNVAFWYNETISHLDVHVFRGSVTSGYPSGLQLLCLRLVSAVTNTDSRLDNQCASHTFDAALSAASSFALRGAPLFKCVFLNTNELIKQLLMVYSVRHNR